MTPDSRSGAEPGPTSPKLTSSGLTSGLAWPELQERPSPRPEAARLADVFAAGGEAGPARPEAPRGRILPNLLNRETAPEAPRPEEPPARRAPVRATAPSGRSPRRAPAEPAGEPIWLDFGPVAAPIAAPRAGVPSPEAEEPAGALPRARARDEAPLKPGERWKRRLPRVLR